MTTIIIIFMLSIPLLLMALSQWQMRKFLFSEGVLKKGEGIWQLGNYSFIEIEYIASTKTKYGKIGAWFWLELLSIGSFIIIFIIFTWTVG